MTHVTVSAPVPVPFSSACEYAGDFFRQHARLQVHGPLVATEVSSGYRLVDDITDSARIHDAVLFSWEAKYSFLPDLAATLRVRPEHGQGHLYIDGRYSPPLGIIGAIFDRLVGRSIARASLGAVLRDIRTYMIRRHQEFRKSLPSDAPTTSGAS